MRIAILAIPAALLAAMLVRAEAPASGIRPYVTLTGATSAVQTAAARRIGAHADLVDAWHAHAGRDPKEHTDHYNPAGVPEVDFTRCEVVALFRGRTANAAGYEIDSCVEESNRVLLRVRLRTYQTMERSDEVAPYAFFVFPRMKKPLTVEEDVRDLIRSPPVWKERARFPPLP